MLKETQSSVDSVTSPPANANWAVPDLPPARMRTPPKAQEDDGPKSAHQALYGVHAPRMVTGLPLYKQMVDRAAYVFITGCFPTHLRKGTNEVLRHICEPYRRPTSIDGRIGRFRIVDDAIRHLKLEHHDMVKKVRQLVSEGYKIQQSLGHNTRRGFSKIFMFQTDPQTQRMKNQITVKLDGAIKEGWD